MERLSETLEAVGESSLAALAREAEVDRALASKSDEQIAELLELAAGDTEAGALPALLHAAAYRLHRTGAQGAPLGDERHAFDRYLGTDGCWLCGESRQHANHDGEVIETVSTAPRKVGHLAEALAQLGGGDQR